MSITLRNLVFADDARQCQRETFLLSQLGAEKNLFLEKSQTLSETIREERERVITPFFLLHFSLSASPSLLFHGGNTEEFFLQASL